MAVALRRTEPAATLRPEPAPAAAPAPAPRAPDPAPMFVERRRSERRGMDQLRAEALQAVISRVEDRNFNGLKDRLRLRFGIQPWRIALVAVALAAGGLAAYLATSHEAPQPAAAIEVPVAPAPAMAKVLVAAQAVKIGEPLAPAALAWQDWPVGAVQPDYITAAAQPDATTQMAGSMARTEILAGEPIRAQKLAPAGQGFLAALLDPGQRGVSLPVNAESSSGGFIQPNDHVDVVLSRTTPQGEQVTETLLRNVRVLAVNSQLGASQPAEGEAATGAQVFADKAIATLALDPVAAQVAVNAQALGKLSLVLVAARDTASPARAAEDAANAQIRMTSPFWTDRPVAVSVH